MERSFGFHLSSLRVFEGPHVSQRGARAYAHGHELHFAPGEYDPTSASGLELLAHEIAHLVQEAMAGQTASAGAAGRGAAGAGAPSRRAGGQGTPAMAVDHDVESGADAMAARAARGERVAGAGPLRPLPALGGPARPKLKVTEADPVDYIVANEIAALLIEQHVDDRLIQILQAWAQDGDTHSHVFATWAEALDAARDAHPRAPVPRAGRNNRCRVLLVLFFLFLFALGILSYAVAPHLNRYEVRPGMENVAVVARRPLGALVHAQHQITSLAQNTTVHTLREATRDLTEDDLGVDGGLEALGPDGSSHLLAHLDELGPQLHAVEPALQAIAPMVEQLSGSQLANPARTGVFHEQIFFGPVPQVPHPQIGGHDHAHGAAAPSATPAASSAAPTAAAAQSPAPPDAAPTPTHTPAPPSATGASAASSSVAPAAPPASSAAQVPPNVGFFADGVRAEHENRLFAYGPAQASYDRTLLEQAATDVASGGSFSASSYGIVTHNCQDFVGTVVARYEQLGGRQVVPSMRNQISLALVDMVTERAGGYLDAQVDAMVGSQLASSSGPPSACARALCDRLGVRADTFASTVDTVLDSEVPLRGARQTTTLRAALCTPPAPSAPSTAAASPAAASTASAAPMFASSPSPSAASPHAASTPHAAPTSPGTGPAASTASAAPSAPSSPLTPSGELVASQLSGALSLAAPTASAITIDTPLHVPLQGTTTTRDLLCEPRPSLSASSAPAAAPPSAAAAAAAASSSPQPAPVRVLDGVVYELARLRGGAQIRREVDSWGDFLGLTEDARLRAVGDLTARLARNLLARLRLARLCD